MSLITGSSLSSYQPQFSSHTSKQEPENYYMDVYTFGSSGEPTVITITGSKKKLEELKAIPFAAEKIAQGAGLEFRGFGDIRDTEAPNGLEQERRRLARELLNQQEDS